MPARPNILPSPAGVQANGTNAVKKALAQTEVIDIRRGRPLALHVDIARIVHVAAKAGMCFQPASVRHVDGTRGDVIDRGAAVGIEGQARALRHFQRGKPYFFGGTGGLWQRERRKPRRGWADGRLPGTRRRGRDGRGRKALVEGIQTLVEHKTFVEQKTLVEGNASPHRHRRVGPPFRLLKQRRDTDIRCQARHAQARAVRYLRPEGGPSDVKTLWMDRTET